VILHLILTAAFGSMLGCSLLTIGYCLWTFRLSIVSALLRETPLQLHERRVRHAMKEIERVRRIGR